MFLDFLGKAFNVPEAYPDLIIRVSEGTIYAHKFILAVRAPAIGECHPANMHHACVHAQPHPLVTDSCPVHALSDCAVAVLLNVQAQASEKASEGSSTTGKLPKATSTGMSIVLMVPFFSLHACFCHVIMPWPCMVEM